MSRALQAAVDVGTACGIRVTEPALLQETNNTVVWLRPSSVVAKVATRTASKLGVRLEHALGSELATLGADIAVPLPGLEPVEHLPTGFVVTLWERLERVEARAADPVLSHSLAALHAALAMTRTKVPSFRAELMRARLALDHDTFMATTPVPGRHPRCQTPQVVPDSVTVAVQRYLRQLDRVLPGVVSGFYLVGSVALGAYRDGRSDIDFIAVLGGDLRATELRRLRFQHLRSGLTTGARAIRHGRSPMTGTCNGSFIMGDHVSMPVTEIVPVASQVGHEFQTGRGGSEVNPVGWKVLAERGIAIRGPRPDELGLDPQLAMLRSWNLANLEGYWRSWTATVTKGSFRLRPRWSTAWGVLGAPRLHHTIATGDVISKETAGNYALDMFGRRWHPLVKDALAYWRQEPSTLRLSPGDRRHQTCEFVTEVIDSAGALGSTPTS